ncbi:MAG: DNA/RNA non-specific endonuclease [Spirosomataceae bacterium]
MKSNKIFLLLVFLGISYFLYQKESPNATNPSSTETIGENPYKATKSRIDSKVEEAESLLEKGKQTLEAVNEVKKAVENTKSAFNGGKAKSGIVPSEDFFPPVLKNEELVIKANYALSYNEKHEQAVWVAYFLRKEHVVGQASRDGSSFIPDPAVSTQTAVTSDYARSGFDRGHLVPAADFKCCQDLMDETFYMSNISPQAPEFNREIWEQLESQVRQWVRRDKELLVITGSVIGERPKKIGNKTKISVPTHFYKILVYQPNQLASARMIAFLLPNKASSTKKLSVYAKSVKELEAFTGKDFFSNMPKNWQYKLEKQNNWIDWAN